MTLGTRESGTARLQAAVAAYRAALEEFTRDRVPLRWAMTQNNLGNALAKLGERESGTARLEEAVVAYRAALHERTRKQVPLDWATTQNNLGNAFAELGKRESGTARLEEAVVAYRAALLERTRNQVPLAWAATQTILAMRSQSSEGGRMARRASKRRSRRIGPLWRNTRASGFRSNGRRRNTILAMRSWGSEGKRTGQSASRRRSRPIGPLWRNTRASGFRFNGRRRKQSWQCTRGARRAGGRDRRLEEAVAAYRAALEEFTHEQVPLEWAMTQNNLGNALLRLGEREDGTARLEEAVSAYPGGAA